MQFIVLANHSNNNNNAVNFQLHFDFISTYSSNADAA